MRWILGAVILAATTYLGFALKARSQRRVKQLEEIERLIRHLDTKLCYLREKLIPLTEEAARDASPELRKFLECYIDSLRKGDKSLVRLKETLPHMQLEDEEFEELCALLEGLGQSDTDTQERNLRHFAERFRGFRERAEREFRVQGRMYTRFGFMGGLLICILLW